VPPLVSRARGGDLKAIGISWHDRVHGVFALPESGIRTASDLKGKRLAVPVRLSDDVDWWRASVLGGYAALFASGVIARDDVELVEVPIARPYIADATAGQATGKSLWGATSQFAVQREEVAALYRGSVDALYSDGALTAILRATTGAQPVALIHGNEDVTQGYGTPCLLTVSGRLLADRPDLVTRWIARLLDAKIWAIFNPDATKRWFAQETGLPEDLLEFAYSPRLGSQADVSLAPNRLALVRAKYDHLLSLGFIDEPFDFDQLFDPVPLAQALALRKSA